MLDEDLDAPPPKRKLLPKIIFGLGVVLLAVAGLMFYNASAAQPPSSSQATEQPSGVSTDDEAATDTGAGLFALVGELLATTDETDAPADPLRGELDQAALPRAPDGWGLMIAEGSGQVEIVARAVSEAIYTPGEPLRVSTLYDLVEAQQPDGEAIVDGSQDQARVYISGETSVMVIIRRLPSGTDASESRLQIASPHQPVPQDMAGRTFMESAGTAGSDAIHALRLDITEDLFIEIGGRVDRATLRQFAEGVDYDAL